MSEQRSLELESSAVQDGVRPVVRLPRSGISGGAIAVLAVAAAIILFFILDGRRRSLSAPRVAAPMQTNLLGPPPPLYIPPQPIYSAGMQPSLSDPMRDVGPASSAPRQSVANTSTYDPYPVQAEVSEPGVPVTSPREPGNAALVVDNSRSQAAGGRPDGSQQGAAQFGGAANRARAGMLANRTMTLAQGTIISAVLETAFDSTRAGFARALVQQDVRGFDGTRVLVPKGSRLIGEYAADASPGQSRATIAWARLIRPDGATIALDSPAVDPVGRNGIRAKVDSHFLERFAGAILQSSLDVGVNLASRSADSSVIVALPHAAQTIGSSSSTIREIRPTLTIAQGTSISVFVARDLDFTDVEAK